MSIHVTEANTEVVPSDQRPGAIGPDLESLAAWGTSAGWAVQDGEDAGQELTLATDLDRRLRTIAKNAETVLGLIENNIRLGEEGRYLEKIDKADAFLQGLAEAEKLLAGRKADLAAYEQAIEQRGTIVGGELSPAMLFVWQMIRDQAAESRRQMLAANSNADTTHAGRLELESFYKMQIERVSTDHEKPNEHDWIVAAAERIPPGLSMPTLSDNVLRDGRRQKGEKKFPVGAARLARLRAGVDQMSSLLPAVREFVERKFDIHATPPAKVKANTNWLEQVADGRRRLKH